MTMTSWSGSYCWQSKERNARREADINRRKARTRVKKEQGGRRGRRRKRRGSRGRRSAEAGGAGEKQKEKS